MSTEHQVPLEALEAALTGEPERALRLADEAGLPRLEQVILRDKMSRIAPDKYQEGYDAGYGDGLIEGRRSTYIEKGNE